MKLDLCRQGLEVLGIHFIRVQRFEEEPGRETDLIALMVPMRLPEQRVQRTAVAAAVVKKHGRDRDEASPRAGSQRCQQ